MAEFVTLEVDSAVGTIRLDRPPMNALNARVQEEIRAAAQEASERDDVRAVVVYGGPKVFAAGADIKEMATMSYTDMVDRSTARDLFRKLLAWGLSMTIVGALLCYLAFGRLGLV